MSLDPNSPAGPVSGHYYDVTDGEKDISYYTL